MNCVEYPSQALPGDSHVRVQTRTAVIVVGLTGFYMSARPDLWERFRSAQFWWMHAMVCVGLLFTLMLFVIEPVILNRHFHKWATATPDAAFARLHRARWILLVLSVVTIFGAARVARDGPCFDSFSRSSHQIDGARCLLISVRLTTAKLFLGERLRPSAESGGATSFTCCSGTRLSWSGLQGRIVG